MELSRAREEHPNMDYIVRHFSPLEIAVNNIDLKEKDGWQIYFPMKEPQMFEERGSVGSGTHGVYPEPTETIISDEIYNRKIVEGPIEGKNITRGKFGVSVFFSNETIMSGIFGFFRFSILINYLVMVSKM